MSFIKFKTPDGRWEYGTGEYNKTMANYLGVRAPSPATSLPSKLVSAIFPYKKQYQAVKYSVASSITIPVFYIWARGADGVKRIAEWPFAKSMRDAAFAGFRIAIADKFMTDIKRVALLNQLQATAGAPSLTNLAKNAAVEKQMLVYSEIDKNVRHAAQEEAGGVMLVLLAAGALAFFIAFR
jgi:hypothetical protein